MVGVARHSVWRDVAILGGVPLLRYVWGIVRDGGEALGTRGVVNSTLDGSSDGSGAIYIVGRFPIRFLVVTVGARLCRIGCGWSRRSGVQLTHLP